jgi:hypothetical protein
MKVVIQATVVIVDREEWCKPEVFVVGETNDGECTGPIARAVDPGAKNRAGVSLGSFGSQSSEQLGLFLVQGILALSDCAIVTRVVTVVKKADGTMVGHIAPKLMRKRYLEEDPGCH